MNYIIAILSIFMLILAIPTGLPYGYYVLLRWVVCFSAAYLSYLSLEQKRNVLVWVFGIITVIFNPIVPLHLGKEMWTIFDGIAAVAYFISMFILKPSKKGI